MRNLLSLLCVIIMLSVTPANAQLTLKAFPTAYGGGSAATGGRGGTVIHVTNLNASGAGSFVAALQTAGASTIVFDVSGVITLPTGGVALSNITDKTVLGQTAPRGGITLTGGRFRISYGENLIIRHIRSRPIKNNVGVITATDDAYTAGFMFYGIDGLMLDHVSASFAQDKGINIFNNTDGPTTNLTISNSLIADSATMVNIGNNPSGAGQVMGNVSYIYNLTGNSMHRTPNMEITGYGEIINNVMHGWSSRLSSIYHGLNLNYIGNYMKNPGGTTSATGRNRYQTQTGLVVFPVIYTRNNFHTNYLTGADGEDNTVLWYNWPTNVDLQPEFFTETMHTRTVPFPSPILTPAAAYTQVLADVGANKYIDDGGVVRSYIDPYDQSVIDNVISNTRVEPKNTANWVLPTLPANTRAGSYDTDNDGLADAWEVTEFGDLTKTAIGNDLDTGYTNIEMFAYQDEVVGGDIGVTGVTITGGGDTVEIGATGTFTAVIAPGDATDQTYSWASSNTGLATINGTGTYTGVAVGGEELTNTGFDTDTSWTKQTGWTISDGKAHCDGTQTSGSSVLQDVSLSSGMYTMEVTISNYVSGTIKMFPGGFNSGVTITGNGVYTQTINNISPSQDGIIYFQGSSDFVGSIDNVSCKEVPNFTVTTTDGSYTASDYVTVIDTGTTPASPPTQASGATINGSDLKKYYLNGVKNRFKN